jgi:hypothetical protein
MKFGPSLIKNIMQFCLVPRKGITICHGYHYEEKGEVCGGIKKRQQQQRRVEHVLVQVELEEGMLVDEVEGKLLDL